MHDNDQYVDYNVNEYIFYRNNMILSDYNLQAH